MTEISLVVFKGIYYVNKVIKKDETSCGIHYGNDLIDAINIVKKQKVIDVFKITIWSVGR